MTAIEVALLLIGVIFILGSFFIVEKLSPTELSRVAELSEEELRIVMDRELGTAGAKISDMAEQAIDLSVDQIQRKLEKDTNEKIMAISEYSDTVMEQLQKMNHEVTFLYSMLGDKHGELNDSMVQLNELLHECQVLRDETASVRQTYQELQMQTDADINSTEELSQMQSEPDGLSGESSDTLDGETGNNAKDEILRRYHAGEKLTDIARDLSLGYGEVKLIVELYKGEENL
ncbi:MAG: DUF6115 domain-containing protein [bacterium]|nr:DUF6115 domain-containing protein [bacterium]MDY4099954.1 DUF6115 domain-containing protein [Lachnospiraceae bacterium]